MPKAPHVIGSKSWKFDQTLDEFESNSLLSNRVIFQEKLDGYGIQLYFTKLGKLTMKHREKSIPSDPKYRGLKKWAEERESLLMNFLGENLIICGEWMQYKNIILYTTLPCLFFVTDVYDRDKNLFWCTDRVRQLCSVLDLEMVPTLISGVFSGKDLVSIAARNSVFGEDTMEGVYIRHEDEHRVINRAQFISIEEPVRSSRPNKQNFIRD